VRCEIARFQFQKRRQLFIRSHNEMLPVIAVCAAIQIVRPSESTAVTQPSRSAFAEIVQR
jgi:hypothetical protein